MATDNKRQSSDAKGQRARKSAAGTGAKRKASTARKARLAKERAALEAAQVTEQRAKALAGSTEPPSPAPPETIPAGGVVPVIGDSPEPGQSLTNQYGGLLEGEKVALDATREAATVLRDLMMNPKTPPDVRRKSANDLLTVAQTAKAREAPSGRDLNRIPLSDLLALRDELLKRLEGAQEIDVTPKAG